MPSSSLHLTLLAAIILGIDVVIIKPKNLEFTRPTNASTSTPTINNTLTISTMEMTTSTTDARTTLSVPTETTLFTTVNAQVALANTFSTPAVGSVEKLSSLNLIVATESSDDLYNSRTGLTISTALLPKPPSDSLTKGFSIPTFLLPYPTVNVAELPSYTNTTALPLSLTDVEQQMRDQLYLAANNKQHEMKQDFTIPLLNLSVQMGNHAYLPCQIRSLLSKPVSWVRVRDGHILSVDQTTFIADQRFQSLFKGENEYTWSLQIKYVRDTDEGFYECQMSTEPKLSAKVFLSVVVPKTELIGDRNRFVKAGSKVVLHCIVRGTLDPPSYIIWFRGKNQIPEDNKMGWYMQIDRNIFGNSTENQNTIGSLIIPFVHKRDSGSYTCQPSNSASVSAELHVLSGEYSASAIMSAAKAMNNPNIVNYLFLLFLLILLKKA